MNSVKRNFTAPQHYISKMKALITDWDDTITDRDTISLVAEAAYITKPDFPHSWDHFSDVYYTNYKQFVDTFGPRDTLEDEVRYQEGLKQIELSSVNEYVGLQLFKGVDPQTLQKQAEKVQIKPNFFEIFAKIQQRNIPTYILSCNWTSKIMEKVFSDRGFTNNIHFITNEFEEKDGLLTGEVRDHVCIRTGTDKVKQIQLIKEKLKQQDISDAIYYFGDSGTDILPMLEVDVGVVVGNGSALKTLDKLKIPYDEGLQGVAKIKHIENWYEINELI